MSDDIVVSRVTAPVGDSKRGSLPEIARLFLRLGVTAFGGPAAHIAMMEEEVVVRRRWVDRAAFLDLLGVVQVLPGPNSTELAIHLGHARAGLRGGMLAGFCFVAPSVLLVWVLAGIASAPGVAGVAALVLWWLAPVVVAVLVDALWKFGRQAWARPGAAVVMPLVTLVALLVTADLLVLAAGAVLAMAVLTIPGRRGGGGLTGASVVTLLFVFGVAWAGLLQAQGVAQGAGPAAPGSGAILMYFLRAGISVFGSGYVLLSYLQHDLVTLRGWISLDALTQASALAQMTPGPLFATATAAGYSIGGHAGALAATVGIFAPAFASVAVSAPIRRLVQRSALLRAALDGVVIASVALLGRAVVGFTLPLQPWQWIACGVATGLMLLRRGSSTLLLLAAVCAGIVSALLHQLPS